MIKDEATLQARLQQGEKEALEALYTSYKSPFLSYFRSWTDAEVDLEDLFQDAVIALYQNFYLKKLELKTGSVKTYLFAIGKFKLSKRLKDRLRFTEDEETLINEQGYYEIDHEQLSNEQKLLAKGYAHLGEKCRELLRLHFYRGLTDKEVVSQTPYKDENTVKSYRSRCLKQLKKIIHEGRG